MKKMECNSYFNAELTDEGLCCSFNMLPPELIFRNWRSMAMLNKTFPVSVYDWSPEIGFTGTVASEAIPLRPLGEKSFFAKVGCFIEMIDKRCWSSFGFDSGFGRTGR